LDCQPPVRVHGGSGVAFGCPRARGFVMFVALLLGLLAAVVTYFVVALIVHIWVIAVICALLAFVGVFFGTRGRFGTRREPL
jgi:hypothetical protein